jgi:IgGFc binding protein
MKRMGRNGLRSRWGRRPIQRLGVSVALIVLWGLACSATGQHTFTGATGGGVGGGSGTGTGTGTGSGGAGGASLSGSTGAGGETFDAGKGADTGGPCSLCSADLKDVTDCMGNVVKACPAGTACAAGVCVGDPCAAAVQSQSSIGCEYWAVNLDNILPGACFAAYVTNNWTAPIHIQADYQGKSLPVASFTYVVTGQGATFAGTPYDATAGLPVGNVAILFLAQAPGEFGPPLGEPCPTGVKTAVSADPAVHGTGIGDAFHITTDGPAVAYQIFPYGGGNAAITSASLLLPVSAWDVNYVAVNAFAETAISSNWGLPSMNILAGEDGTQVTISPVAPITAGPGVAAAAQGTPTVYNLDKGQYVQFTQSAELTGSAILANKPIATFGGSSCMNVPVDQSACDTGGQQIPPVRALGHEYAAVRYRGRNGGQNESVPWRLVGAVAGTQLTYTPSTPAGAPTTLGAGELVTFDSTGPFIVASQDQNHPFYASAHMTGGENFGGEGDAEFVNIVPTAQYLTSYVFFTDLTYPETNLVLIRAAGASGFEDVTLDCAGVVGGWTALGSYEYTRVDLVTGNFQGVNGCGNGVHYISSKAPFGVTVWGWGSNASFPVISTYVSYAYPAGAGVRPVNNTVVMPMTQ